MRASGPAGVPLRRAVAAYQALRDRFGTEHGLLAESYPPGQPHFAYLWPYSQALAADLTMAGLPAHGPDFDAARRRRLDGLERYWRPSPAPPAYQSTVMPPLGQLSDVFYDDNLWVALALLEQHRLSGEHRWLARAEAIFRLIQSGWDSDPAHPAPGGMFWVRAAWSRDRNTVSTAPAAKLAAHLYEQTGMDDYLDWALRLYAWVERYLRAPNGLYWDHIDLSGRIDKTQWSYNQGSMIGANALLYRVTNRQAHLDRARELAAAALAHYERSGSRGLLGQPVAFNAILFRNLLLLQSLGGSDDYRPALHDYVDSLWAGALDQQTGLIRAEPGKPFALLDQAAAVQLAALLARDPAGYALLA